MKKVLATVGAATVITAGVQAETTWTVDNVHSNVKFTVTHLVISEVEGNFKVYSGTMTSPTSNFTDGTVEFSVDVNSINTDNEMRDKHLKSDDFFNAEKYPHIVFKSTRWKQISDQKYVLEGDLTIRDVTRHVAFDVTYGGSTKDAYGNTRLGFRATGSINRFDYNLKWDKLTEAGGAIVGKDVAIRLNLEFVQKKS